MVKVLSGSVAAGVVVSLLIISNIAFADIVYLKNGGKVKGAVVSQSGQGVVIDIGGGTVTHNRNDVARIEKSPAQTKALFTGAANDSKRIRAPKPKESVAEVVNSMAEMVASVLRLDFLKRSK